MNKLKRVFCPTEEEIKEQEKKIKEIHNKCIEDRRSVKLIPNENSFLYRREPFGGFLGDCCCCSHYLDGGSMTEGGDCMRHNIACGWGFTCKDNDSEWAINSESI